MSLYKDVRDYIKSHPGFPDKEFYDVSEDFDSYTEYVMFHSNFEIGIRDDRYYPSYGGVWSLDGLPTLEEAMKWGREEIEEDTRYMNFLASRIEAEVSAVTGDTED